MIDWSAMAVAFPFVVLLLGSGIWASRRFARFEELPGHFDFKGRASRMTPRAVMVWMLPAVFSIMLIVVSGAMAAIPKDIQKGEATTGILICAVTFIAVQGLVLWLTDRWARAQK